MKNNDRSLWNRSTRNKWSHHFFLVGCSVVLLLFHTSGASGATGGEEQGRVVRADVVAIDRVITYNRFGSYNPNGMIYALARDIVDDRGRSVGAKGSPGKAYLRDGKRPRPLVLRVNEGDILEVRFTNLLSPERLHKKFDENRGGLSDGSDSPKTRDASIVISGMTALGDTRNGIATGISGIKPGDTTIYRWIAKREGTYLFFSNAAPAGGEGDGGSLVHGLFGAVNVEPKGSQWYRSQLTETQLKTAKDQAERGHFLNYEARDNNGNPVLNMLNEVGNHLYEIVHGDLNAIIVTENDARIQKKIPSGEEKAKSFREFTVIFHDELKTEYAKEFAMLEKEGQLAGVRDGFAINYGASGMGTILLANRLGIGPSADCIECFYEEFFLQSWANGDPALRKEYLDDPSNVHHSYLGDNVKFRNLHAGPKETHVFHLHAHQWLSQEDKGTYLDSQTIAPSQGFSYNIHYGGSGNRNLSPGDSIFHCHLYPHFAQGMWALWRVHDVFEDGSRRLPDGEHGKGTDPITGETIGGTPIPAVIPIPDQAMAPQPSYKGSRPGYPFFIPGVAGHRVPQAPYDLMMEDGKVKGGLPRHIILSGDRETLPLEKSLELSDFAAHLTVAQMKILPHEGTPLEKAAIAFHSQRIDTAKGQDAGGHFSTTPEGKEAIFRVNGLPATPGAPFADPCPVKGDPEWAGEREYKVSAIQLDMKVNSHGWHDPQARINVLAADVKKIEAERDKGQPFPVEPFFFRAHSGECVTFYHTNRTPKELDRDHFQVKTPTDIIGQHIHLVKFDVMAADGSANGWNYEDGTFAWGAIDERIKATQAPEGSVVDWKGKLVRLERPNSKNKEYQTTIQRWWADPLLDSEKVDRTIRTVFTHDHFAPSSIQQHGFYSALVIEPAGTLWTDPSGKDLPGGYVDSSGKKVMGGVGARAIIQDPRTKLDHREFMLAIADFALLYDKHGNPIDKPEKPEAISVDHHNPYLVNYKHDPIPLRIGEVDGGDGTIKQQWGGDRGNMAFVFDSELHGDPFLAPFNAYEGDRIQVRVIQGAQEVQHTMTIHGLRWLRDIGNENSPYVNAQEIGISEHFEMDLPAAANIPGGLKTADYLFHFGSIDALWNGAWGLLRSHEMEKEGDKSIKTKILKTAISDQFRLEPLQQNPTGNVDVKTALCEGEDFTAYEIEAWRADDPNLNRKDEFKAAYSKGMLYNGRENIADADGLLFVLRNKKYINGENNSDTERISEILIREGEGEELSELRYLPKDVEPLVIRARAGDCLRIKLKNKLKKEDRLPSHSGDAELPRITNFRADLSHKEDDAPEKIELRHSSMVSLHPQLLSYDIRKGDSANIGHNTNRKGELRGTIQTASPQAGFRRYEWYAGITEALEDPDRPGKLKLKHTPEEFGAINLTSFGDIISHGTHGLVGALIIEPETTTRIEYPFPDTRLVADIYYEDETGVEHSFREFVVIYQDGLNLKKKMLDASDWIIPDCHICDDSYDLGEKALNYRSEPFWARLDHRGLLNPKKPAKNSFDCHDGDDPTVLTTCDTNNSVYPDDFFMNPKPETPIFKADPGMAVRFRVLEPIGRARQRSFMVYGHDYYDYGMKGFGSPNVSLISPGKGMTASLLDGAKEGCWIYRDGPNFMYSGGVWGLLEVGENACKLKPKMESKQLAKP